MGVGYGVAGAVKPLNSQVLEIVFDLGAAGLLLLYGTLTTFVLALGSRNPLELTLRSLLIFLAVQSLTIQDLQVTALVMGGAAACLRMRSDGRRLPPAVVAEGPARVASFAERRLDA
jgi:hypothetical protein